jgi:hypothetical protein
VENWRSHASGQCVSYFSQDTVAPFFRHAPAHFRAKRFGQREDGSVLVVPEEDWVDKGNTALPGAGYWKMTQVNYEPRLDSQSFAVCTQSR